VNVAIGAASIVEPQGFSGSLPVIFLCVVNSVTLFSQIEMLCSVLHRGRFIVIVIRCYNSTIRIRFEFWSD